MRHALKLVAAFIAGLLLTEPALADFAFTAGAGMTSVGFDGSHSGTGRCTGANIVCFGFVPMDTAGAFLGTAPGTGNTSFALPVQGVAGGVAVPVSGTVAATQSGNWTARVVGNAGAVLDFAGQNAASPANSVLTGCQFNTSPTTITSGNASPIQCNNAGNVLVFVANASPPGAHNVANSPTVNIASDQIGTAGTAASPVLTVQGIASMTPVATNQTQFNSIAVNANPCLTGTLTYVKISQTAAAKLVSQASSKKNYVCAIFTINADAENLSLVEGTQTTTPCDTSTAAIIGGTTAAAGPNLLAGGGFTFGDALAPIAAGATNNLDVCLLQSGSGRVAGSAVIAQQ